MAPGQSFVMPGMAWALKVGGLGFRVQGLLLELDPKP